MEFVFRTQGSNRSGEVIYPNPTPPRMSQISLGDVGSGLTRIPDLFKGGGLTLPNLFDFKYMTYPDVLGCGYLLPP
jgi:hypothetical protein